MKSRRTPVELAAVASGGALGASARWAATSALPSSGPVHWGTPLVNVLGSALLAAAVVHLRRRYGMRAPLRDLFEVGFCGGFTTFSTFSVETARLFSSGQGLVALVYATGTLVACTVAAGIAGMVMLRYNEPTSRSRRG